jgi:hypothetical protein
MPAVLLQETSSSGTGTSTTITPVNNCTPGSYFHIVWKASTSGTPTSCSDPTNGTYAQQGSTLVDASSHHGAHFVVANTSGAKPLITIAHPSGTSTGILFREIGSTAGLDGANSFWSNSLTPGANAATCGNVTPTGNSGFISAAFEMWFGAGDLLSPGTGFTVGIQPLSGWGFIDSMSESGNYASNATATATANVASAVSFSSFGWVAFFKDISGGPNFSLTLQPAVYNMNIADTTAGFGLPLSPVAYSFLPQRIAMIGPNGPDGGGGKQKWRRKLTSIRQ